MTGLPEVGASLVWLNWLLERLLPSNCRRTWRLKHTRTWVIKTFIHQRINICTPFWHGLEMIHGTLQDRPTGQNSKATQQHNTSSAGSILLIIMESKHLPTVRNPFIGRSSRILIYLVIGTLSWFDSICLIQDFKGSSRSTLLQSLGKFNETYKQNKTQPQYDTYVCMWQMLWVNKMSPTKHCVFEGFTAGRAPVIYCVSAARNDLIAVQFYRHILDSAPAIWRQ